MAHEPRNIAGVVVLYNPGRDVLERVESYRCQVHTLFAVDNSDDGATGVGDRISHLDNVHYVRNEGNLGIARALNIGAARAIAGGYDFLLTMDQDGRAAPGMVEAMLRCLERRDPGRVGVLAPFHLMEGGMPPAEAGCREVLTAMTSGSLVNLEIFREMGPFREEFFIDYVDDDYCLRLNRRGYKVLRADAAILEHHLGNIRIVNLGFRKFSATNHSPFRRYFMTRNRFCLMNEYREIFPDYYRLQLASFWYELRSIVLFERDKGKKLARIWQGYRDYRRGIFPPVGRI